jgi:hypothetical protein
MKCLSTFIFLFFIATAACAEGEATQNTVSTEQLTATVSGQVMIGDKQPMPYGIVLLYDKALGPPPSLGKYWRVPDLINPLGKDGQFSLEVTEGTYYLQVSQKNPGAEVGPANESENLYFHGDADGNALPVIVSKGAKIKLGQLRAFLWKPDIVERNKGITAVEGVVLDTDGKPVERALVLAYYNDIGQGRPVFISERTDKSGRYQLRTDAGGTFFLKVRSVVGGGKPSSGEYLNTTKEFAPTSVTLKKGETLKGITLKVMKFSRPGDDSANTEKRDWGTMVQ